MDVHRRRCFIEAFGPAQRACLGLRRLAATEDTRRETRDQAGRRPDYRDALLPRPTEGPCLASPKPGRITTATIACAPVAHGSGRIDARAVSTVPAPDGM